MFRKISYLLLNCLAEKLVMLSLHKTSSLLVAGHHQRYGRGEHDNWHTVFRFVSDEVLF